MTPKTSWNKLKSPTTFSAKQLQIEKLLTLRLKSMGYLLFVFSLASLLVGVLLQSTTDSIPPPPPTTTTRLSPLERSLPPSFFLEDASEEIELNAMEVLNFYFISIAFASVGFLCLFYSRKTYKKLLAIQLDTNDQQET